MSDVPKPRIALIGLYHETNTFAPARTELAAFERRGVMSGDAWIAAFAGTRTVGGGFIDGCARVGLDAFGAFGAYATPSGLISRNAMATLLAELEMRLGESGRADGVLLELHGALVAEGYEDAERDAIAIIRRAYGEVPIVCVSDLHANMRTRRFADVDALIGYRTNPHVDTYDRGAQAAHVLAGAVGGTRLITRHRGIPAVAIPAAQATSDEPLASITAEAGRLTTQHGLVELSVHAGYAYADVPHLGMGFTATAAVGRGIEADAAVEAIAAFATSRIRAFARALPDPAEALSTALAATSGLAVVTDTGDNINGGAPGDGTWLLEPALHLEGAPAVLTTVWDPVALAIVQRAGEGATVSLRLGGHAGPLSGEPVVCEAQVLRVTDGRFVNTGPMATGARVSMGGAALVRVGAADIVVQNEPVQPNDPALFRSLGAEPAGYRLALLKGAAAVRAGWSPLTDVFVDCATRGASDSRLERLHYRHASIP